KGAGAGASGPGRASPGSVIAATAWFSLVLAPNTPLAHSPIRLSPAITRAATAPNRHVGRAFAGPRLAREAASGQAAVVACRCWAAAGGSFVGVLGPGWRPGGAGSVASSGGTACLEPLLRKGNKACATSPGVWYRSAGFLASILRASGVSSGGTSRRSSCNGGGASRSWACKYSRTPGPRNGGFP